MRIWLQPDRLATLKMAPGDVIDALNEQNQQYAAGKGETPTAGQQATYSVTAKGRLSELAVREHHPARERRRLAARLKDVARVELAAKDYSFIGKYNGRPATLMGVFSSRAPTRSRSARRCATSCRARALPRGLHVRDSVRHHHVRRGVDPRGGEDAARGDAPRVRRGVPLPAGLARDADPVRRGAGVADRHLCGPLRPRLLDQHSTLFGMVLAIGIVVDDAIVVLENVERIMKEEGLEPRDAAVKAMQEVTSPIIAIVLVLCAVFIPIAFLGGLTGELYRQFAVTISIAVVISGFVALTLTPSLCAIVLKSTSTPTRGSAGSTAASRASPTATKTASPG